MRRLLPLLAIALVAAAAALLWPAPKVTELTPLGAAMAQEGEADTSLVREIALGSEEAPVTVIEYASATCPHCKNFHENTFKEFKANYIDAGKARFIYREVYFDRFGLWAAMVARCGMPADAEGEAAEAADKRYFAIMDRIFSQQKEWLQADSPAGIAANLSKIGRAAGLGADQIDACLQDAEMAKALVAVFQANAEADDIQSTPTFFINGEKHTGDMSYSDFSALVDAQLGD